MVGHIKVPQLDMQVASLSRFWVHDLLREKWKYQGLIITDDLGMKAVTPQLNQKNINMSVKSAFNAGVDIFLLAEGAHLFAQKAREHVTKYTRRQTLFVVTGS